MLKTVFLGAIALFSTALEAPAQIVPMITSTEQLRTDFIDNAIAADRKYGGGREFIVLGKVLRIGADDKGNIFVGFTGVDAHLVSGMKDEAATYRPGDDVQLTCVLGSDDVFIQLMNCRSPTMSVGTKDTGPRSPAQANAAILISAEQYHQEYANNRIAADQKYKGRTLSVFGMVRLVGRATDGKYYVSLMAAPDGSADVNAVLLPNMADQAAAFRPGQQLQLICVGGATMGTARIPALADCKTP